MAQTTGAISWVDSFIEYSLNGSDWIDCSGFSNAIEVSGGDRATAGTFTSDGDTPILTAGKRDLLTVALTAVYTAGSSDVWQEAHDQYDTDGGDPFYLRWAPAGSDSGNQNFTTSAGEIVNPSFPQGAADSPDALMADIQLVCASITKGTI